MILFDLGAPTSMLHIVVGALTSVLHFVVGALVLLF
jgi:hypothetical protein